MRFRECRAGLDVSMKPKERVKYLEPARKPVLGSESDEPQTPVYEPHVAENEPSVSIVTRVKSDNVTRNPSPTPETVTTSIM